MSNKTKTYEAWKRSNLKPLWESKTAHRTDIERETARIWRWQDVRPLLDAAFKLTTPEVVERRVLTLIDPKKPDSDATVGALCVAYQALLPGESARAHRHSMNAIRLVLEGDGAETIVDGKSCPMEYGDLILTPGWTWHEHHHAGQEPVIWLDVLDVPLHEFLGTTRFQSGPVNTYPATIADEHFIHTMFLPDSIDWGSDYSPVFRYPYKEAIKAIEMSPVAADGTKNIRYSNPLNGDSAISMIDCRLTEVKGVSKAKICSAHSTFCVLEGEGRSVIGDDKVEWSKKDVIVVPGNIPFIHESIDGAKLFCISDRELFRRLGLLEERIL